MLARFRNGVEAVEGEIALATDALDRLHVDVWIEPLVGGDAFVEEALALLLLAPEAGADEAHAVDDYEVTVGAGSEFVVQLERDVVWVIGPENLAKG